MVRELFSQGRRLIVQIALMKSIFVALVLAGTIAVNFAADVAHTHEGGAHAADQHEHAAGAHHADGGGHHELTPDAPVITRVFGLPISNSMLVTWVVALGLIIFAQVATRNIQDVPQGAQNFWEWMVESLHNFLDGIIGHELTHKTFWFFATIFIFILFANWVGLIPGVGTMGWGHESPQGKFVISTPLLRGANADLNMTLAMAIVFFVCWTVWAIQVNGPGGFLLHLFGPKGDTTGLLKVLMIAVFVAVGLLEVVSILFRPVSLSFRLFGNIFAGESMLESMGAQSSLLASVLVPIPFYFMEILVGFVQALVFMLLTAVFTLLICTHDEGPEGAHH